MVSQRASPTTSSRRSLPRCLPRSKQRRHLGIGVVRLGERLGLVGGLGAANEARVLTAAVVNVVTAECEARKVESARDGIVACVEVRILANRRRESTVFAAVLFFYLLSMFHENVASQ